MDRRALAGLGVRAQRGTAAVARAAWRGWRAPGIQGSKQVDLGSFY
jgi:hypothetical protein